MYVTLLDLRTKRDRFPSILRHIRDWMIQTLRIKIIEELTRFGKSSFIHSSNHNIITYLHFCTDFLLSLNNHDVHKYNDKTPAIRTRIFNVNALALNAYMGYGVCCIWAFHYIALLWPESECCCRATDRKDARLMTLTNSSILYLYILRKSVPIHK